MENVMTESLKAFMLVDRANTSVLISGGVRDTYPELPTSKQGEKEQPILGTIEGVMSREERDAPEALTSVLPTCKKVVSYKIPVNFNGKLYQVSVPAASLDLFESAKVGQSVSFVKSEGTSKAGKKYALLNFHNFSKVAEPTPPMA